MRKEFEVHVLNEDGIKAAQEIALEFEAALNRVEMLAGNAPDQRCLAILRTKMEEAAFFAKKAMACNPSYQKL